jgi:hypothetical protein
MKNKISRKHKDERVLGIFYYQPHIKRKQPYLSHFFVANTLGLPSDSKHSHHIKYKHTGASTGAAKTSLH